MTTLIALDTSGALCSVALLHDGVFHQLTRNVVRKHNMVVLEMLDALCNSAGILPAVIEGVAYVRGPGSFTGVRLCVTAAQAIAMAASARVFGCTTSRLLALHAQSLGSASVVSVVRSRGETCYLAAFRQLSGATPLQQVEEEVLTDCPPAWLSDYAEMTGEPPAWLPASFKVLPMDETPALTLLHHASAGWPATGWAPVESALPMYIDGDHPWRPVAG